MCVGNSEFPKNRIKLEYNTLGNSQITHDLGLCCRVIYELDNIYMRVKMISIYFQSPYFLFLLITKLGKFISAIN